MDFDSLLAQAGSNARKNSKKLKEADQQLESERRRNLERLAQQKQLEKAELKRRLPPKPAPPPEPKFVIPKKNQAQQSSVDKSKLTAFLERQERVKQEKFFQKQQEKEELIRLRIAASGGKANKKIAKHFGKSPLELQRRYAHNPDYEDTLIRQAEREQEEHDRLSALYRQGVYRALNKKDEVCAMVGKPNVKPKTIDLERSQSSKPSSSTLSKPYAVPSTKPNGIAKAAALESKKRKSGAPSEDFQTLMQKAQMNREINPNAFEFTVPTERPAAKKQRPAADGVGVSAGLSLAYASKRNLRETCSPEYAPVEKANKVPRKELFNGDQLSLKKLKLSSAPESRKFIYDDRKEAPPKSSIPAKQPKVKAERIVVDPELGPMKEKRYLPGDVRAKQAGAANGAPQKRYLPGDTRGKQLQLETPSGPNMSKSLASQRNGHPTAGSSRQMYAEESRPSTAAKRPAIRSQVERTSSKLSATARERYGSCDDNDDIESALARKRRELEEMERAYKERQHLSARESEAQRLAKMKQQQREERMRFEAPRYSNSRIERKRSRSPAIRYANYSETDEEDEEETNEDEYDSDMADFIDDSTVDDLQREDFEESLRMINPRYDKKKWMMREKMISDRQMDARFRDIESEERHSARVAIYEDLAEARRGSKALA